MIKTKKSYLADFVSLLLVALAFIFALWMYPRVPRHVPIHWNAEGHVNGTIRKPWGVFLGPLMMVGIGLLLALLPRLSPVGFRMESFRKSYDIIRMAILGFLLLVTVSTLLATSGFPLAIVPTINVLLGLLFVVLGNFMPKFRKNFFVGIRTPWTLADDEVWLRTHRLAGWLFVAGGLVLIVEALLGLPPAWSLGTIAFVALTPLVGSYVLYRRIHPRHENETPPA